MSAELVLMTLKLLDLLAGVVIRSVEVRKKFDSLRLEIETMASQGRGPSPEEWAAQNARVDELHALLQSEAGDPPA